MFLEKYENSIQNMAKFFTDIYLENDPPGYICVLEYSDNESLIEEDIAVSDCLYDLGDDCIKIERD
jgi:hypothetical protein